MPPATIAGSIAQSGSSVTGAVHIDGSNCFDQLTTIGLTGTLTGSNVSLSSTSVDGQVITFTGSITNNALTGTYAINGSCANGDHGSVTGFKVLPFSGTWRVILEINDQHWIGLAEVTQGNASSEGSFSVSGTSNPDLSCLAGTIQPGTFPSPSFIMGASVALEIETNDGIVVFQGTVNEDGSEISGYHHVSGGTCDGYFGGGCFGRDRQRSCHVPGLRPEDR